MAKKYEEEYTKVALCVSCNLADAMKHCELCPLRIGLPLRAVHHTALKLDDVRREEFWSSIPAPLWDQYVDYLKEPGSYPDHYNPYKEVFRSDGVAFKTLLEAFSNG